MEENRTNKHVLGLAPSVRREKFVTLLCSFLFICELSRPRIRAKLPQSHQERRFTLSRWPTRPLGPQVLAVSHIWPSASPDFCRLLSTADCPVLVYFLPFCSGTFLPSSSSVLVGNLACSPFVWASCQNRQRNPLIITHSYPHPQKRMPNIVPQLSFLFTNFLLYTKPNPY